MGNYRITRRGKIVLVILALVILFGIYMISYGATNKSIESNNKTLNEIEDLDKECLPKFIEIFPNFNKLDYYSNDELDFLKNKRMIVYFLPDSPELSENAKTILQGFPYFKEKIIIEGNINGYPDFNDTKFGMWLAKERATRVENYLVKKGFSKELITIVNNGSKKPVNKDGTKEQLSKNRRVEVYYDYKENEDNQ